MSVHEADPPVTHGHRVRPLVAADLKQVQRIEETSYSVPWSQATFQSLLDRPDTDLLCAEVRGEVAGYAIAWFVYDQGELGNVAVGEKWRRRGIGTALIEAVLERATKRGARELFLEVRRSNVSAQRLYHRLGFRQIGVRRNYYARPVEDALVMRHGLEPVRPA